MSDVTYISPSVAQQQAISSLLTALEAGRVTVSTDGSLLFDILGGPTGELVFDETTSDGSDNSIEASIYSDGGPATVTEVATVRITVRVIA